MQGDSERDIYIRKRNGLIALAVGFAAIYALCLPLGNEANVLAFSVRVFQGNLPLALAWIAGFLLATNVGVIGFFLVLAGLKELPLKTSARAGTGFRLKIVGANALAVGVGLVAMDENGGPSGAAYLVIIPFAWVGVTLIRRGFRYDAISAAELLVKDARAPVVYLRSFKQDDDRLVPIYLRLLIFFVALNFEQILAAILSPIGPFVAIGRPAEDVPELGAARMYFPNDQWREQICAFMERARLVVIRLGTTDNIWWEVEHAIRTVDPARLILVVVESRKKQENLLRRLGELLGKPLREPEGRIPAWLWSVLKLGLQSYEFPLFLTFSSNWEPRFERCGFRWSASAFEHPAWPSIEYSLRRILRGLGLEAKRRKSRETAFILTLLLGWAGAHCFYLGQRRRGWKYLLFFWTMVPAFLSLRDATRITMASRDEFEALYPAFRAPAIAAVST
jgi:TM2 domain-containing membrane protein YozV